MPPKTARRSATYRLASLVESATAEAAGAEELGSKRAPASASTPATGSAQGASPGTVPVSRIRVRPGHNPRKSFDPERIRELADTIEAAGVVQPLVVETRRQTGKTGETGDFWLVQGERRLRAVRLLVAEGRAEEDCPVPVWVRRGLGEEQRLTAALVENLQREDLEPDRGGGGDGGAPGPVRALDGGDRQDLRAVPEARAVPASAPGALGGAAAGAAGG